MRSFLIVSIIAMTGIGCSSDVEIHAPEDAISESCLQGKIHNTAISCLTPREKIASDATGEVALVVFIEPGDYSSNMATQDENVRLVANSIPSDISRIKPFLRQIMINLSVAHLRNLIETHGSRYDHIYFFRSDVNWDTSSVALALKNVLTLNKTVDILMQVHGSQGAIALDPNLQVKITVADIQGMKDVLSKVQRDRVRAIFNSACYSASYPDVGTSSIAKSLVDLFPRSVSYGSFGVNYGPLHRDMVGFESYYARGATVSSAVDFGNLVLTKMISGAYTHARNKLNFPVFSIKGQARYFGFRKTEWQTVKLPALAFPESEHWKSYAFMFYGQDSQNPSIYSKFSDRYEEVDLRAPASYLNPPGCFFKGKHMAHGSVAADWKFEYSGQGENSYESNVTEYKITCANGNLISEKVFAPIAFDPSSTGGY